jgi:O-antigen/teichoic acid export membrane protein
MPGRDLGRKSLVLFASTWGSTAIGMLASLIVARALGPDALGSIGFSLGLAGLVMAAALPGFAQAHLKRLAEGQDIGRCIGTMLAIQGVLSAALLVVVTASWPVWRPSGELGGVFAFVLGAQVAGTLADAPLRVFVAREWAVAHACLLLGGRLLRLALTVLIVLWVPHIVWIAASMMVENVFVGAAASLVLVARHGVRVRPPTRASVASYWTYARPFLVTTPIALVQDSADRFVVGRFAGLTAAGYYHVARALFEALASLLAAPMTFLFTRLSSVYARRSEEADGRARALFFEALDKLLFVTTPLAFLFWALAEPLIVLLYGPSFVPAVPALRILVLATIVMSIVNPYTLVVMALDAADRFIPVNIFRLAVYLGVLIVLVATPGPRGAVLPDGAAAAALARLVLVVVPAWVYWRWTRDLAGIPFYERAWTYVLGFAAMAFISGAIGQIAGGAAGTVAGCAVALATYLGLLLVVHPGTSDNLRYVRSLLSPAG